MTAVGRLQAIAGIAESEALWQKMYPHRRAARLPAFGRQPYLLDTPNPPRCSPMAGPFVRVAAHGGVSGAERRPGTREGEA